MRRNTTRKIFHRSHRIVERCTKCYLCFLFRKSHRFQLLQGFVRSGRRRTVLLLRRCLRRTTSLHCFRRCIGNRSRLIRCRGSRCRIHLHLIARRRSVGRRGCGHSWFLLLLHFLLLFLLFLLLLLAHHTNHETSSHDSDAAQRRVIVAQNLSREDEFLILDPVLCACDHNLIYSLM